MEQNNREVPFDSSRRLVDIMLDNPTLVKLGDKEYKIRDLRVWSRARIADIYLRIKHTEKDVENILLEASTNLKYAAEIIAIILLNDKFTEDLDNNEAMISKMTLKVMLETTDESDWTNIIIQAISSLGIEQLFFITAQMGVICKSLMMRKEKVEEQYNLVRELQSESVGTS